MEKAFIWEQIANLLGISAFFLYWYKEYRERGKRPKITEANVLFSSETNTLFRKGYYVLFFIENPNTKKKITVNEAGIVYKFLGKEVLFALDEHRLPLTIDAEYNSIPIGLGFNPLGLGFNVGMNSPFTLPDNLGQVRLYVKYSNCKCVKKTVKVNEITSERYTSLETTIKKNIKAFIKNSQPLEIKNHFCNKPDYSYFYFNVENQSQDWDVPFDGALLEQIDNTIQFEKNEYHLKGKIFTYINSVSNKLSLDELVAGMMKDGVKEIDGLEAFKYGRKVKDEKREATKFANMGHIPRNDLLWVVLKSDDDKIKKLIGEKVRMVIKDGERQVSKPYEFTFGTHALENEKITDWIK
jgi:hypothetical protein